MHKAMSFAQSALYSNIMIFFPSWLPQRILTVFREFFFVFFSMWNLMFCFSSSAFAFNLPFTVIHGCVLAVLQVHQKQGQPAGRSECFLALMRPECAWSMSTVGLTAQEISFPIENPFLRGSYCHSMAESKPTWSHPHELNK